MVRVRNLELPEVRELIPERYADERGYFSETWNAATLAKIGIDIDFVQDNQSFSVSLGVMRGLHYQVPPFAQDKLVRVTRGAIYDVAVDIRHESPTFGRWVGLIVSAEKWNQIFVPAGFAHGFMTVEPQTEVFYKVSAPYSSAHERAIRYDDPAIGIDWPRTTETAILSDKDGNAGPLSAIEPVFAYQRDQ